jgi:hypothetical protein
VCGEVLCIVDLAGRTRIPCDYHDHSPFPVGRVEFLLPGHLVRRTTFAYASQKNCGNYTKTDLHDAYFSELLRVLGLRISELNT